MQNTATFRTVTRGTLQFLVVAAVAAVGISIGRWVIPDSGTTGATAARLAGNETRSISTMERKLTQMDAWDDQFGFVGASAAPAPRSASTMERKLAQMDAEDDAR